MAASEPERWDVVEASEHERWLARPFDDPNGQEVIVLTKLELLHALPRSNPCGGTEPGPNKPPVSLRLVFEMSVRSGPGTTYSVRGKLPQDSVLAFTADARPQANGYVWRKLAAGYEGAEGWIAEGTVDGSKTYLSPLS